VASRAFPLLRYDPAAEGVFGARLDLSGNPAPDADWAPDDAGEPVTPATWAATEARFANETSALATATEARQHAWRTLQEIAGVVTPFTDRVRAEIEAEQAVSRDGALAALRAEHQAALAALRAQTEAEMLQRVEGRLMALAGFGEPSRGGATS